MKIWTVKYRIEYSERTFSALVIADSIVDAIGSVCQNFNTDLALIIGASEYRRTIINADSKFVLQQESAISTY